LSVARQSRARAGDRTLAVPSATQSFDGALRDRYGHTPLSLLEPIPWACRRLIVGTGVDGALPIDEAVVVEAARRGVELVALPTDEACALLSEAGRHDTAAVLHVTC
jgi:hypothetical protein